jgi:nicotinamide riboside transporter PnuC
MIDCIKFFVFGLVWIGIITTNGRLVANYDDWRIGFGASLVVTTMWIVTVREVTLSSAPWWTYSGYVLGAAVAQALVMRFVPRRREREKKDVKSKE